MKQKLNFLIIAALFLIIMPLQFACNEDDEQLQQTAITDFDPWQYDINCNGQIDPNELEAVINDFEANKINKEELKVFIELWESLDTGKEESSAKSDFDPCSYDFNSDGIIDKAEAVAALSDYLFDGTITKEQAVEVLSMYLFGGTCGGDIPVPATDPSGNTFDPECISTSTAGIPISAILVGDGSLINNDLDSWDMKFKHSIHFTNYNHEDFYTKHYYRRNGGAWIESDWKYRSVGNDAVAHIWDVSFREGDEIEAYAYTYNSDGIAKRNATTYTHTIANPDSDTSWQGELLDRETWYC